MIKSVCKLNGKQWVGTLVAVTYASIFFYGIESFISSQFIF